jgi:hypothetical protein
LLYKNTKIDDTGVITKDRGKIYDPQHTNILPPSLPGFAIGTSIKGGEVSLVSLAQATPLNEIIVFHI